MEVTKHTYYNIHTSIKRVKDILDLPQSVFIESNSIPSRDSLTYSNGYYVNVSAIFIDIVGSSDLTSEHKRPVLAKIYKSFISECVAYLEGIDECKEININGDCVWGVLDTRNMDSLITHAAFINGIILNINKELQKRGYSTLKIGIGIDYGRALMVKAGYPGSGINDVIWMGDVINSACHLCNKANRDGNKNLIISQEVFDGLSNENKQLFRCIFALANDLIYQGDIIIPILEKLANER